jgi:hypothetical protein
LKNIDANRTAAMDFSPAKRDEVFGNEPFYPTAPVLLFAADGAQPPVEAQLAPGGLFLGFRLPPLSLPSPGDKIV